MESFLTTLPPYVHQYINKYPPTECFNILKDLICFAVLYSNNHERINLLSLELLQKGADNAVTHKPYTSSELVFSSPSLTSAPSSAITSPNQSTQHLSPASINKSIPSPSLSAIHHHHAEQLDLECRTIMEEPGVFDEGTIVTPHVVNEPASTIGTSLNSPPPHTTHSGVSSSTVDPGRKSTMPYTFPEWWAHPDSDNHDHMGKNTARSVSPVSSSNGQQVTGSNNNINNRNSPKRLTTTQEVNITNWIPIDFEENGKGPTRNQTTTRPASLYNPTIPDLRSYLGKTEHKQQTEQANGSSKMTRQISVPAATPPCDPIAPTISKSKPQPRQSLSTSRSSTPRLLTRSISSKTQTTTANPNINNNNNNNNSNNSKPPSSSSGSPMPLSRSSSTRSTASSSTTTAMSSSAKAYRPGQTATVRARAEQAKQRQLQLEEEKRKQAAASTLTSRTSLRLRQQAASGIDWDSIKKERRKTMPASGV